jgi:hypothetical protein
MADSHVYKAVNSVWPEKTSALTEQEAIAVVKRLWRKFMGRPCPYRVKITSGNRYNWIRRGTLFVNPDGHHCGGWHDLTHDLSHLFHRRLNGGRPHANQHAYLERQMREYVLANGWLDGKLKKPERPAKPRDVVAERYARLQKREADWEKKLSRAENALARVQRQRRDYERRHGERLAA